MTRINAVTPRVTVVALALLLFQSVSVDAAGMMNGQGMGMMGGRGMGMMGGSIRHAYYMRNGLPPEYAGLANPLPRTSANLAAGQALYEQVCASCHGVKGRGDGEAGRNLTPPPSDLTSIVQMPMTNDAYLFWAISEGGAPFNSAMPAMKSVLKADDIWKLVLYLQSL